jgi:hypothetical protein
MKELKLAKCNVKIPDRNNTLHHLCNQDALVASDRDSGILKKAWFAQEN